MGKYLRGVTCTIAFIMVSCFSLKANPGMRYYELINKAELAVCSDSMNAAQGLYEQAFAVNPRKPFSKDLLNAFHCAMDNSNSALAKKYLEKLLARGMTQDMLRLDIYRFYNEAQQQMIRSFTANMRNDTLKSNEFIIKINSMLAAEKALASISPKTALIADSLAAVNERNVTELLRLFYRFGVPNEDIVGSYRNVLGNEVVKFATILTRYRATYSYRRINHDLDSFLLKAIFTYDYDPKQFATDFHRFRLSYYERDHKMLSLDCDTLQIHFPLTDIYEANYEDYSRVFGQVVYKKEIEDRREADRKKIGLESKADFEKKFEFTVLKNKDPRYRKYHFVQSGIMAFSSVFKE